MKKVFSIILCFTILIGICPVSYGVEEVDDSAYYEFSLEDLYPELAEKANKREAKPIEFYINNKLMVAPKNGPQFLKEVPENSYFDYAFMAELLIPVSYLRDGFGYQVGWDPAKQEVSFNKGEVKAYIGKKSVEFNNRTLAIDNAPVLRDNGTYVTLRFLEDALGWEYTYDDNGPTQKYNFTKLDRLPALTDEILSHTNKNENYRPLDVPIYGYSSSNKAKHPETVHWVEWDKLGSNTINTTKRAAGTEFNQDLEYLNSLVGRFGYGFAKDGQLQIGDDQTHIHTSRGSSDTYVAIGHGPGREYRSVAIRAWITKGNPNPGQSSIVQNNLMIESIKYLSNSIEDAHAIISYYDKFVNKKEYPPFNQNMTFGSTKVRFEKRSVGWGFHVIFND